MREPFSPPRNRLRSVGPQVTIRESIAFSSPTLPESAAGRGALPQPEQIAAASPNYLSAELAERLSQGPIQFRLQVQLSGPGDKIDDPSVAWPSSREAVELGTVVLMKQALGEAADKPLLFLPSAVTKGIATADHMLEIRTAAYPISAAERQ